MPIGCMVTLRRERMYEFYPEAGDHRPAAGKRLQGYFPESLLMEEAIIPSGLKEQIIFPEIEYDKVDRAGE